MNSVPYPNWFCIVKVLMSRVAFVDFQNATLDREDIKRYYREIVGKGRYS